MAKWQFTCIYFLKIDQKPLKNVFTLWKYDENECDLHREASIDPIRTR